MVFSKSSNKFHKILFFVSTFLILSNALSFCLASVSLIVLFLMLLIKLLMPLNFNLPILFL